ncbi:MAG TPA: SDR family NAD(P)-dependent oxidoreductase [Acidimicrobiia bacterium]|nr:SDR family NAD(P)-dependent oxidoreductase [Acidimicrobiia bacterium]
MNLRDRLVIVTGGGSGIGRATAARIAREGGIAAVMDQHRDAAEETTALVRGAGGNAHAFACDVSDDAAVRDTVAQIGALGRVQGVVTSAGIFYGPDLTLAHKVPVDVFVRVLQVNLVGTFSVIAAALPAMMDSGGAIVTIASTAALRGHGYGAGYTASKGGVDALTRLLAVQYGPHGVRANCICPGGVDTPMTAGTFSTDEAKARAKQRIPVGRYAQPEDIADVAAFLLSDDSRYMTGQTFPVEGGALIS